MKKNLQYAGILVTSLLFLWGGIYLVTVIAPRQAIESASSSCLKTVRELASCVKDVFGVTPVCNDRTLAFKVQETRSIMELSTVSRQFTHYYRYSTTWMKSAKNIDLVGIYEAKAGIDLNREIKILVSPDGKLAELIMPPAELHSMTKIEEGAIAEDSGLWNRITSQDKEIALRKLSEDARKTLLETDFLQQAETRFYEQIRQRLEEGGLNRNIILSEKEASVPPSH